MFVFLSKYKSIVALVCLCAVSLILSWSSIGDSSAQASNSLEHKLEAFLAPAHFCYSFISDISAKVVYVISIFASICEKPAEKAELQNLKNQVKSLESEVENLKHQLNEEGARNGKLPAKVIAVEPTDWFRYLTINRGRKDGVDVDMAVITWSDSVTDIPHLTGSVVGRITKVWKRSARVQLITDRWSVVAVTIESLEDLVLMNGQPETENCVINEIPSTTHDRLKEGNAVIVDERSSIFPPGTRVGEISSIEKGIHFCRIEVQPDFKFSALREVMVVLDAGYWKAGKPES